MKKYDAMYIFTQAIPSEDAWAKLVERMQAEITRLGGEIISTETLGKKTFARVMQKRENGVYLKIRFLLDAQSVKPLLARYRLVEDLFRVQVLAVCDKVEAKVAEQTAARKVREATKAASEAANTATETVAE